MKGLCVLLPAACVQRELHEHATLTRNGSGAWRFGHTERGWGVRGKAEMGEEGGGGGGWGVRGKAEMGEEGVGAGE